MNYSHADSCIFPLSIDAYNLFIVNDNAASSLMLIANKAYLLFSFPANCLLLMYKNSERHLLQFYGVCVWYGQFFFSRVEASAKLYTYSSDRKTHKHQFSIFKYIKF